MTSDIQPPIFIFAEGTMDAYESVGAAEIHLKPWYVEDFSPIVYDSRGTLLKIQMDDGRAHLVRSENSEAHVNEFCRLLTECLKNRIDEWASGGRVDKVDKLVHAARNYW